MGIIQDWLETARRAAAGRPVAALRARIGRFAAVEPNALRFAFDAAAPAALGVPAPRLDLETVPPVRRCTVCGATYDFLADGPSCPACHSPDADWLSGFEIELASLAFADFPSPKGP